MRKTLVAGIGAACVAALGFAAKDPVIMTVNGVDVPKSEFEYLYNKNNTQQINPQSLDDYVELFKLYKLKVADAKAEGIDTLASFVKEMEQYRHELAAPYLADSVYINSLVDEAYKRLGEEVEAKHIMIFKTRDAAENEKSLARIDSIRNVILKGDATFEEMATKFSRDRRSAIQQGRMGWITANQYPYAFEIAAYETPEGKVSEIVESPQGYHLLKGGKHRPARGKVQASHILKLTQNLDSAGKERVKFQIDSIYQIVKANPALFAEVAKANSEDRGSARQGGALPLFGTGEMVEQFDSVAFALPDGAISEPFETPYGWHIIYKMGHKGIDSRDQMKSRLLGRLSNPQDARFKMIRDRQTAKLAKKHKASLNPKAVEGLHKAIAVNGLDSVFFEKYTALPNGNVTLAVIDGKNVPVKDFLNSINKLRQSVPASAKAIFDDNLDAWYNGKLTSAEEDVLYTNNADYHNLLNEYVDGSMLYEVSVRKVWDKAAKDEEGLKKYFEANREHYKWTEPHVKGFLVQAPNDSVAELIRARAAQLGADTLVNTLRKEFPKQILIEKVLVSKGTNALVDNLMFDGPAPKVANAKFPVYFLISPRVITVPEEVADVKGLVTSDLQNAYQESWETELRNKYPVKVYDKVLRQVKKK